MQADKYGEQLLASLGSAWNSHYAEADRLDVLYRGVGHTYWQAQLDFATTLATLSRLTVPVFRREDWTLLVLRKKDRGRLQIRYGQEGLTYSDGAVYGEADVDKPVFPLPSSDFLGRMTDIPYTIYNRVLYPSKTWTSGMDFIVDTDRGTIEFLEDPFESPLVARRDVFDEQGVVVDEEIGLWVYGGQYDLDLIYKHWGFAVAEQLRSSEGYKAFVNALWDSYVIGAHIGSFTAAMAAVSGIPLVLEQEERVEDIVADPDRKLVITNAHVYEFKPAANITVSVGDTVFAGQSMSDAIQVSDLSGAAADIAGVSAFSFGQNFLSGGYTAALTFSNYDVDLVYHGPDADGRSVVTFQVGGSDTDIEQFFAQAQERGKESGQKTLAELLDMRDAATTQPTPTNGGLPATINPLQFVLQQLMRNNLILVKVRVAALPARAPGLQLIRYLRDIVPPHTTYIVFVEIEPEADTIELDESEQAEDVLGEDTMSVSADLSEELNEGADYEDALVRVYLVSEECP